MARMVTAAVRAAVPDIVSQVREQLGGPEAQRAAAQAADPAAAAADGARQHNQGLLNRAPGANLGVTPPRAAAPGAGLGLSAVPGLMYSSTGAIPADTSTYPRPASLLLSQQLEATIWTDPQYESCVPGFGRLRDNERAILRPLYPAVARISDVFGAVARGEVAIDRNAVSALFPAFGLLQDECSVLIGIAAGEAGLTSTTRAHYEALRRDRLEQQRAPEMPGPMGDLRREVREEVRKQKAKMLAKAELAALTAKSHKRG